MRDRRSSRPRRSALPPLSAGMLLVASAGAAVLSPAPAGAATPTAVITAPAQTVAGFGASGAWWVNDLANFSASAQSQVAGLLFGSGGIELSQYRYNIGGGGVGVSTPARAPQSFLTSSGSYNWSNDAGGQYFLKAAAADGVPDLIGFVNSAPSQYTTNGKNCGGNINTADDAAYGTYVATIVSHFASTGVHFGEISPMNEPDDSFSSCGQEGMAVPASARAGVIDAVGSALGSAGQPTKIIADESSQTTQLLSEAPTWLADSSAPSHLTAIAHHTYNYPSNSALEQVGALGDVNTKPVWASEICCQVTGGGYGQQYDPTMSGALVLANYVYTDFSYADDSAFQWWTALSSALGCNPAASGSCPTTVNSSGWNDGLVYYDPNYASDGNQNVYPTKRFYALGQYSRYVRPGAVRYGVSGSPSGVQTTAFWHNGQWTVVANNANTSATTLSLNLGSGTVSAAGAHQTDASENLASIAAPSISGSTISASLPAQSVTTYVLTSSGNPGSGGTSAHELVGVQSGKCLDVPGASTTNGTQLDLYSCNAGSNQEYTLNPNGEITVYTGSGMKCLDAYQQGKTAGTIVDIYTCGGGSNQLWQAHPDGSITNNESGLCLDAYGQGTANGTKIDLYTCNGGTNQQWTLN
ncbi:MAG TPA: glycoside hydrolase [Actinocrinis sp.]|uniref:glycoside hydrolase n=1 Tax=Actinocrinis sp. TaxID=1920516 RepID=UPI002DDCADE1|nr:glycoside hydrolase [Actinocrinis sp.]HEV2346003.1 glycoside hydrolase [Actinocrinis sp.]